MDLSKDLPIQRKCGSSASVLRLPYAECFRPVAESRGWMLAPVATVFRCSYASSSRGWPCSKQIAVQRLSLADKDMARLLLLASLLIDRQSSIVDSLSSPQRKDVGMTKTAMSEGR